MQVKVDNFEKTYKKTELPNVRSGDTIAVHQRIVEGSKERVQVFEGVVIRTHRKNSLTATATVRRNSGGVGVEKTFMLHAPNIEKIVVSRHSKVRRNYLSYLRKRSGKSARLKEIEAKEPKASAKKTSEKKKDTAPQATKATPKKMAKKSSSTAKSKDK